MNLTPSTHFRGGGGRTVRSATKSFSLSLCFQLVWLGGGRGGINVVREWCGIWGGRGSRSRAAYVPGTEPDRHSSASCRTARARRRWRARRGRAGSSRGTWGGGLRGSPCSGGGPLPSGPRSTDWVCTNRPRVRQSAENGPPPPETHKGRREERADQLMEAEGGGGFEKRGSQDQLRNNSNINRKINIKNDVPTS